MPALSRYLPVLLLLLIGQACVKQAIKHAEIEAPSLEEIYAAYSANDGPLAAINFNTKMDPAWAQADLRVLRQILEESNPNLYRKTLRSA